tara:strand:+ start:265 stop:789 length:525 start_codon:yes stop_codon:yes gene_type:complete
MLKFIKSTMGRRKAEIARRQQEAEAARQRILQSIDDEIITKMGSEIKMMGLHMGSGFGRRGHDAAHGVAIVDDSGIRFDSSNRPLDIPWSEIDGAELNGRDYVVITRMGHKHEIYASDCLTELYPYYDQSIKFVEYVNTSVSLYRKSGRRPTVPEVAQMLGCTLKDEVLQRALS